LKREEVDEPEKANDGLSNGALFSGIAGDSMKQVVLCSCLVRFGGFTESIDSNFRTRNSDNPSTGKPLAGKLA
jgi:hypothetical protein